MKKNTLFVLVMLCCCLLFLVACGDNTDPGTSDPGTTDPGTNDPGTNDPGETYTIKMSLQDPEDHPVMAAWVRAAEAVEEATDGQLQITRYAAGVLGDYITVYEDLQRGAVDLSIMSLSDQYSDLFSVMMMPYAVSNYDEALALYNPDGSGAFYNLFAQGCEETNTYLVSVGLSGFLGVSATNFQDFDNLLTPGAKHPGIIVRVPMMETYVNLGEALGFSVTTIAYGDVYTSLQTGVCDGVIGTPAITAWENFRDVINWWVDYRYVLETVWAVASFDCKERIPADLWAVLEEEFHKTFVVSVEECEELNNGAIENIATQRDGALIPTAEELAPMVKHVQDVCWPYYANFYEARGGQDFVDMMLDEIAKVQ